MLPRKDARFCFNCRGFDCRSLKCHSFWCHSSRRRYPGCAVRNQPCTGKTPFRCHGLWCQSSSRRYPGWAVRNQPCTGETLFNSQTRLFVRDSGPSQARPSIARRCSSSFPLVTPLPSLFSSPFPQSGTFQECWMPEDSPF